MPADPGPAEPSSTEPGSSEPGFDESRAKEPAKRCGLLVSFEGIDGSGKSTQARLLADRLRASGGAPVLTREPGGSPGAEDIRKLLVEGDPRRWSAQTEILLFTAARRDHLERTIAPALEAGRTVITDRFADSTRVYQAAARPEAGRDLRALVDRLHADVIGIEPDLTLVIDMAPEKALVRGLARRSGEDRFEEMGLDFQHRLRAGFRALAVQAPDRVRVVDGDRAEAAVAAEVAALFDAARALRG